MLDENDEILKELIKTKKLKIKSSDSFLQFTGYWNFFFTFIITLVHPAPFLLTQKLTFLKESYYLSDGVYVDFSRPIFEYFVLIQVAYALGNMMIIFLETRPFMTHRTQRIAKMGNHTVGAIFALRYYLRKFPIIAPLFLLMFGAVFFGSLLRITEVGSWNYVLENVAIYPDEASHQDAKSEFQVMYSYINTVWYVFITITTVGYGDIYVKGTFSRFIMYAFGLWGMISLSMIIATFMNLLSLDQDEKRFLKLMDYFKIVKRVSTNLYL